MAPLLVGTSGFSYEDWRGVFYPAGLAKKDMLDYYAGVFPALEVNATYYMTPGRRTAESMVRRAAGQLQFVVKAPGKVTHGGDLSSDVLLPWQRFLEPFEEAGVLAAVLLQFPARFHEDRRAWELLTDLGNKLPGRNLVVELRHESWDAPAANEGLRGLGLSRSMVDQPEVRGLSGTGPPVPTGPVAYARFHGRNAREWYGTEDAHSRYRYRYRAEELRPWAPVLRQAAEGAASAFVFFNNHPDGNAVLDAVGFSAMLGAPIMLPEHGDLFGP